MARALQPDPQNGNVCMTYGEATMKRTGTGNWMNGCRLLATMLAVAGVASGSLGAAQRPDDRASNRTERAVTNRLTGTYHLNQGRSDNAEAIADRAIRNLPRGEQQRLRNALMRRLEAPVSLSIERDGRAIAIASSHARQVRFEADGREQIEQSRNGRQIRTTAKLSGDRLIVATEGDRSVDYQVTCEPIEDGRRLRVTRRITHEDLSQAVVAKSVYDKTSDAARFDRGGRDDVRWPAETPRNNIIVPDGTQLVAVLQDTLSTKDARDGDRMMLRVRSPSQYSGATIEGYLERVVRSGQVSGRAEMSFALDRIRLRNGRTYNFAGDIESVRTTDDDTVRVDHEGTVQDEGSQTARTVERTGIGAAIGAVIGAIAGGGKGAAIGATVGAGAGAGSVFLEGRNDLELKSGAEFRIRARSR